MAEETITILKIGTEDAVKSIADLRQNISNLKDNLKDLEIGSSEYQSTLEELEVNQRALKDAMHGTTATMEDVVTSAKGASESYNGLVNRMAKLKEEFRATNSEAKRSEIGAQIHEINTKLKEMDALQGNFQRNVGNYKESFKSAFKDMSQEVDSFRKAMNVTSGGLNGFKDGLEGISKSPGIATFGILVSVAVKLADELKKNDTAMEAMKKALNALKPVAEFFSEIIQKLAVYLADVISKVTEFVGSNGLIDKVIKGVMGVGNAILQFIISPFKAVAAAIKVFQEEGIKGFRNAAKAFGDEFKSGVSFKQNFETGQAVADTIIAGAKSRKKEVKAEAVEIGETIAEGVAEGIGLKKDDILKALAEADKALDEERKQRMALQKELDAEVLAEWEATNAEIDAYYAAEEKRRQEDLKSAMEAAQAKKDTLRAVADATSDILSTMADLYDEDAENNADAARKSKNLRIASATIDTITGAVGAFMQSVASMPPPYGAIVGAVQAAAVTAAGMAQIAKIRSTRISTGGGGSSVSASIAAPPTGSNVQNVRSVTSNSEEERLNQMAQDQRVYILSSDIEASQNNIKTQVAESTF